VPHAAICSHDDVQVAAESIRFPAILKTSRLGYDGKGQRTCQNVDDVVAAFDAFGEVDCVLEQRIELAAEISVVLARAFDDEVAVFPVAQNVHVDHITVDITLWMPPCAVSLSSKSECFAGNPWEQQICFHR